MPEGLESGLREEEGILHRPSGSLVEQTKRLVLCPTSSWLVFPRSVSAQTTRSIFVGFDGILMEKYPVQSISSALAASASSISLLFFRTPSNSLLLIAPYLHATHRERTRTKGSKRHRFLPDGVGSVAEVTGVLARLAVRLLHLFNQTTRVVEVEI